jgi:ferric-dicitrate binding protein FerR (iron transport regulator)
VSAELATALTNYRAAQAAHAQAVEDTLTVLHETGEAERAAARSLLSAIAEARRIIRAYCDSASAVAREGGAS